MAIAKCSICHQEFTSAAEFNAFSCDNEYHDYSDVLEQFESRGTQYSYAIVGTTESGKSYYLLSILQKLYEKTDPNLNEYMDNMDIEIELIGKNSKIKYQELQDRLLSGDMAGNIGADNKFNHIPIIVTIRIGSGSSGKIIKLVFFDMVGEYFKDPEFLANDPRVFRSKGIIFLVDPYQDSLLNKLVDNGIEANLDADDTDILNALHRAIISNSRKKFRKVTIPIAFCLSMFDLLEPQIPEIVPEHPYLEFQDFISRSKFDNPTVNIKSAQLKQFLGKNSKISMKGMEEKFQRHAVFAFSAMGHNDIDNIAFKKIEPRGVLAPLFWLLAESGFIPSK